MRFFVLSISWLLLLVPVFGAEIVSTSCELDANPVGVTNLNPRFGWQLSSSMLGDEQSAYEIMVSPHEDAIVRSDGDWWHTKKVVSSQSQFVRYEGKDLLPGVRYYWKVRVWDKKGSVSLWSKIGYWEMAPKILENVKWIGAISKQDSKLPQGRNYHSPSLKNKALSEMWNGIDTLAMRSILLRKSFGIDKKIKRATVCVSGLGHYEMHINGKKIGDSEFTPYWSDYDKTVYYNIYHIDSVLTTGSNVVGVMLGNGFYNVVGNRYRKLWVSFGPPTLFLQMNIEYADGTKQVLRSDESWRWKESPITFNCLFGGEDYDATLEQSGWDTPIFNDNNWKQVVLQEPPKCILRPQQGPPIKVMKQYSVQRVTQPVAGTQVFDMGQNLAGFPSIRLKGKRGQKIKILVGELLTDEGVVNQKRSGGPYYHTYTLRGDSIEEWHPRFSYYGFQFIQIEGADYQSGSGNVVPVVTDVKSNFVYNSARETGSFECSNELFNRTHLLINNAVKSNWQSVFTDCPHREKLGWIEETYLNGPGLLSTYNLRTFIPKVMQDMEDGQKANGLVPNIAPEYVVFGGDFTDSPEWGVASIVLPWMYFDYYGDTTLIRQHYPMMKKYVDYLTSRSDTFIVSHGLGDWYDYGEHAAGYSKNSPIALSATAHYYFGALQLSKAAGLLGNADDERFYRTLCNDIKAAYNKTFFNEGTRQYGTGSQYSNAVSLFLELVDPRFEKEVLSNLVADVRAHGNRLTTGDVGNRYLYNVLAKNGYNDVMYLMHNHTDPPGYGFQVKMGLTTLTEQWDPRKGNSWNHFMMGQIDEWFYTSLAGISPMKPGFKEIKIQPEPVADLTYARAKVNTSYGDVKVSWTKSANVFEMTVDIPVNATAALVLPFESVVTRINNSKVKKVEQDSDGRPKLRVGSGRYTVKCILKDGKK